MTQSWLDGTTIRMAKDVDNHRSPEVLECSLIDPYSLANGFAKPGASKNVIRSLRIASSLN